MADADLDLGVQEDDSEKHGDGHEWIHREFLPPSSPTEEAHDADQKERKKADRALDHAHDGEVERMAEPCLFAHEPACMAFFVLRLDGEEAEYVGVGKGHRKPCRKCGQEGGSFEHLPLVVLRDPVRRLRLVTKDVANRHAGPVEAVRQIDDQAGEDADDREVASRMQEAGGSLRLREANGALLRVKNDEENEGNDEEDAGELRSAGESQCRAEREQPSEAGPRQISPEFAGREHDAHRDGEVCGHESPVGEKNRVESQDDERRAGGGDAKPLPGQEIEINTEEQARDEGGKATREQHLAEGLVIRRDDRFDHLVEIPALPALSTFDLEGVAQNPSWDGLHEIRKGWMGDVEPTVPSLEERHPPNDVIGFVDRGCVVQCAAHHEDDHRGQAERQNRRGAPRGYSFRRHLRESTPVEAGMERATRLERGTQQRRREWRTIDDIAMEPPRGVNSLR